MERPIQAQRGGKVIAPTNFPLGTRTWVVSTTLRPLYSRKDPLPLNNRLDGPVRTARRSRPLLGFDRGTIQPVASRYADYAILAVHYDQNCPQYDAVISCRRDALFNWYHCRIIHFKRTRSQLTQTKLAVHRNTETHTHTHTQIPQ
jgi:hypothetical protein